MTWALDTTVLKMKWKQILQPEMSAAPLCFGRILFFLGFVYFFWSLGGSQLESLIGMPEALWHPIGIFQWMPRPHPNHFEVMFLTRVWQVSLLAGLFGVATRVSVPVAFVLSLFVLGHRFNFGKVDHQTHLPMLVMAVLALSPCGDEFSLDAVFRQFLLRKPSMEPELSVNYGAPIRLIQFLCASVYLTAAMHKLIRSGWEWMSSANLIGIILSRPTVTPFGFWTTTHPQLCFVMAVGTIVVQFSMFVAWLIPEISLIAIPGIVGFHVCSYWVMGDHAYFLPYLICLVFWVPALQQGSKRLFKDGVRLDKMGQLARFTV